jgi:two-component system cell cycle sensor histidine kinase/response regulator CckA
MTPAPDPRRIEIDRLHLLLSQLPSVCIANLINPCILGLTIGNLRARTWLTWIVSQAALASFRWLRRRPLRQRLHEGELGRVARELSLHSLASGLSWGLGSIWLIEARPASLLGWSFVVGGMVTAAAGTTAVHFPSFVSFAFPSLAALGVRLAVFSPDQVGPMPLLVALFTVLMTAVARRTHQSLGHSFKLRHENGELITQLTSARTALWESNRELESQVEQRTAELASERARLAQWIQDAPDGLLTLSGDQVLALNPALARILGRRAEELVGARLPELLRDDPAGARDLLERCASSGQATLDTRIEVGGDVRHLAVHAKRASGEAALTEIVIHDVTERRRAEQQRHEREDTAHRAARFEAIRRLSGGVAHEFNNILAVMQGTVESALAARTNDAVHAGLQELQAAIDRAAGVTRQLVAISQRPRGKREPVDLNGLVLAQRPTIERMVGQEVRVEVAPSERELSIVADAFALEEALFHLVLYLAAVQLGDTRSDRIVLCTAREGERAVLELRYERPAPGTLAATNLRTGPQNVPEGTFELNAARILVEQEGGALEPPEIDAQHVRLRLSWPLVVRAAQAAGAAEKAPRDVTAATDERGVVILAVDDEPALLELVAAALDAAGHRVLKARSPAAARQIAADTEGRIDVLLTDVVMAGTDGPALASELRQRRPELKVCFMSGYTAQYLKGSLGEWTNATLLEKPFTLASLVSSIRALSRAQP